MILLRRRHAPEHGDFTIQASELAAFIASINQIPVADLELSTILESISNLLNPDLKQEAWAYLFRKIQPRIFIAQLIAIFNRIQDDLSEEQQTAIIVTCINNEKELKTKGRSDINQKVRLNFLPTDKIYL